MRDSNQTTSVAIPAVLDMKRRVLSDDGVEARVSNDQARILQGLARSSRGMSTADLISWLYTGRDEPELPEITVRTQVCLLRAKLRKAGMPALIASLQGRGSSGYWLHRPIVVAQGDKPDIAIPHALGEPLLRFLENAKGTHADRLVDLVYAQL